MTIAVKDPDAFLKERSDSSLFRVERIPLQALSEWRIADHLAHSSGRFFTVEGLSVETNFGPVPRWFQPIIVQPDIGILGILVKRIEGEYHFLMQAKMEPGNSALVQYAATVQATPSNYERVHGGRSTPYLQYFLERNRSRILVDLLLSEHASWYLHKRNRNMIVEVPADEEVPLTADFTWLTLRQLRHQLARGNRVNMNARTVLSCISYGAESIWGTGDSAGDDFHAQVIESHQSRGSDTDVATAMTWLIDQKANFQLDVRRIALRDMDEWVCDEDSVRHQEGRYFQIVGLSIGATSREVASWDQPMLEPTAGNVVAFICQNRSGVLEFLVQAVVQPGLTDRMELAATIQLSPGNYRGRQDFPPLVEYLHSPDSWVRLKNVQSEDGGRFLHADTTHVVINVPDDHVIETPENYCWMSLGVLNRLISYGYYVNVEARSLLACML